MAIAIAGLVIAFPFESKPVVLMGIAIVRFLADYGFCWKFYFPAVNA
jgi:hypothetical protein